VPRGSIGRRVARAAATGGNRSYRGRAPVAWYASLVLISATGLGLIGYSRYEANLPTTTTTTTTTVSTTAGPTTHWYAALTADICGKVSTLPISTNTKDSGIISIGSGIIYIAPGSVPDSQAFSGNLATLGQFVTYYQPKMVLSSTELQLPGKGQKPYKNGALCGTQPGEVQVESWATPTAPSGTIVKDPSTLKWSNGEVVTVAFLPKGATIPEAPKATQTELELDLASQNSTSTSTTLPVVTSSLPVTSTTKPGQTTTTVKSGSTTSTTAGSTTTTTAPSGSSSTTTTSKP
jgi:hypothetical protein